MAGAPSGVAQVLDLARARGLVASGYVEELGRPRAIATKNGLFAHHEHHQATATTTMRTPDGQGSGWAARTAVDGRDLDYAALAAEAADLAERTVGGVTLEPGRYPTVFSHSATANLWQLLASSLDRRRTDEGRSFLSRAEGDGVGEALLDRWLTVRSRPADGRCPVAPFDREGLPHHTRTWIEGGRVTSLPCGRFWASQRGESPIAEPPNLLVDPGSAGTLEQLIADTERGVLVTSLWYIRPVDPRALLFTGITRDGVFWIEQGKVVRPLKNLRVNDGPLGAFARCTGTSRAVRAVPRGRGGGAVLTPAIRAESFHFSSTSDAI